MKSSRKRMFHPDSLYHIYQKADNGFIIFYSIEDYLVFFTLFSIMAPKYKIRVVQLSIMPNHFHIALKCVSESELSSFMRDFESQFALIYNKRHSRQGQLFYKSYGAAPKTIAKSARACMLYIANNPVEGKLIDDACKYRWTFLAYYDSRNPFSNPVQMNRIGIRMRRLFSMVDWYRNNGLHLNYELLDKMMVSLNNTQRQQLVDYIISKYLVLETDRVVHTFGGWYQAKLLIKASSGSEHDIREDWEDYSVYRLMINEMISRGYEMSRVSVESIDKRIRDELIDEFRFRLRVPDRQIKKFFHLL